MAAPTRFILNDRLVESTAPHGLLLLDFLRLGERLTGTKEGCKEGDCGACAVLIGELEGGAVRYRPVTSCLVPLAEVHGRHVVTIEGCNLDAGLTPVQEAVVEHGATQCGFCTPGIVVSLHGLLLDDARGLSLEDVKYALSGHLCRCTGYRSLKDCAETLDRRLGSRLDGTGGADGASGANLTRRVSGASTRKGRGHGSRGGGSRLLHGHPGAATGSARGVARTRTRCGAGSAYRGRHRPVRATGGGDPGSPRGGAQPAAGAQTHPRARRRVPRRRPDHLRGVRRRPVR